MNLKNLELKAENLAKEPGYYLVLYAPTKEKNFVHVTINELGDLVIHQIGTNRVFEQTEVDKNFFWSEKIEI